MLDFACSTVLCAGVPNRIIFIIGTPGRIPFINFIMFGILISLENHSSGIPTDVYSQYGIPHFQNLS